MCIVGFSISFTNQLAAIHSSLSSHQILALIPSRPQFCFGHKTAYAVNARVDGMYKAGCRSLDSVNQTSKTGQRHILVALATTSEP